MGEDSKREAENAAGGAGAGGRLRRRLAPGAALLLALAALEYGLVPRGAASGLSNTLQLAFAATAAASCFAAARRQRALGRAFFVLVGLAMALWATGQLLWTLRPHGAASQLALALQDLLFVGSMAPLIAACVVRPHAPRRAALGLAADLGLVSVLALFVYAYFPVAHAAAAAGDPFQQLAPALYNPQRLILLGALLFLLRGSSGTWRVLYIELALAMVVFHVGGLASNVAVIGGSYRPGLLDLPWMLPFLWLALAARDFGPAPGADELADAVGWEAADWREARRGNAIALVAVALVPAVHQLATLLGSPQAAVYELRSQIALAGTLLVGGLYLARQLHVLRRAESTQATREARFRALVENSADAIGIVDRSLRFSYLSASTARVTGHAPDALLGSSPLELVHADELDTLRRALSEVGSHPRARAQGLVRYRHRDGSFRHGAIDAVNRGDTPAVGGVVLHLRDVTERRRAEEERERSLSLLEATVEATADGILVVDRQGRVVRFNQKLAAMWRIPPELIERESERAIGFVLEQLQDPEAFLARVQELYSDPEAEGFDVVRFKDGRVFERYSLPQRLGGEVVGRVFSFRDVSERARAEQAMARLVAIIEATPDCVATCDAALRPLYLNRAGRLMLGLAPEGPLAQRDVRELHPPLAAARLIDEVIPAALRDGAWSGETRLRHRDGREIPVLQVVLAHRSQGGEVAFFSAIARDISQRIEAERELRRSHTMAALGSLVAGVAQQVRSPLFGISSTLDAFEARFADREDHRPYVRVLREQLDRLTGLMSDLLEYAKPIELQLVDGRLEPAVAAALAACAPLAERGGVAIDTRFASDLPPLRLDERRLSQVFRNLIENALQHAPSGSRVRVEARRLPAGRIECTVEDDGPGFQPADLPHLFEPFFTRRHGGTGLGLSIVQRIVADHGGSIEAANHARGGARLTLVLPAAAAAERVR